MKLTYDENERLQEMLRDMAGKILDCQNLAVDIERFGFDVEQAERLKDALETVAGLTEDYQRFAYCRTIDDEPIDQEEEIEDEEDEDDDD